MVDTTNTITVFEPRWNKHHRDVLIGVWRVVEGLNRITMPKARNHPDYFMTGFQIRQFPIETHISKAGNSFKVYAVPLEEMKKYANNPKDDGFRTLTKAEFDNLIKTGKL